MIRPANLLETLALESISTEEGPCIGPYMAMGKVTDRSQSES